MTSRGVFTPADREQLRDTLVDAARADSRLVGAAHLGSAARDRLDRWSDIDLALAVDPGALLPEVIEDWTRRMYGAHGAFSHLDVRRGTTLYRVFLLADTLQVDLSFWPATEFAALGPAFKLIYGTPATLPPPSAPSVHEMIGLSWLYALHVRSSMARGRWLQADYMLGEM